MIEYLQTHVPRPALDVLRLAIWLALLALVFVPVERLWAVQKGAEPRRERLNDLGYYFLNNLLPGLIIAVPAAYLAWAAHRLLPWPLQQAIATLPTWARLALLTIVAEFGFYWGHRWSHQIPLLWQFHAVHHSAERVDWLVNTRAHPLDIVFTRLCGLAPVYLLGLAQPLTLAGSLSLLPIVLTGTLWGFFIHANVRWRFGWLEQIVTTPAFHHWHHTRRDHPDHNYASLLPVLDRIFGTYHLPRSHLPDSYGTDTPVSRTMLGQLTLTPVDPPARSPKRA